MSSQIHTYFFARLNVIASYESKRDFVFKALTSGAIHHTDSFKYGFFDAVEFNAFDTVFAYGRLVKYKPLLEGEIVDERKHELVEGGLPDGIVAKSDFFVHYNSSVVAYRPIANRISARQFRDVFSRLIELGYDNFFVSTKLESIEEELQIEEAIKSLERISRVSFEVHPTNPSNRDVYKRVDERLKALRASRMKQVIEANNDSSLNVTVLLDDDVYRGIMMAADGYGKGSVSGIREGNKVTINTEDSPVKKEVVSEENPAETLNQLLPAFERIWKRMNR